MNLTFHRQGWEDYLFWQETDKKTLKKINDLIKATLRNPFEGLGEPEPLRFQFSGYWSRRITQQHRLVYKVDGNTLYIIQCRFHYDA